MISKSIFYGILIFGFIGIIQGTTKKMEPSANLTTIKWAHAVNSKALLDTTLNMTNVEMIEADVILGNLFDDKTVKIPVMAHPPANESDLSLEMFLDTVVDHNNKHLNLFKGVKLDFKSIEAFHGSTEILKKFTKMLDHRHMWLNADILKGPGNSKTLPVNASEFILNENLINGNSTLSIGWTTHWEKSLSSNKYNNQQIEEILLVIKNNSIVNRNITFPVRAVFAANSITELNTLVLKTIESKNYATLTIWSGNGDIVDTKKLRELILKVGVHRVYLDLPKEIERNLHLNSSSGSLKVSLMNYTVITIIMVLISEFLKK